MESRLGGLDNTRARGARLTIFSGMGSTISLVMTTLPVFLGWTLVAPVLDLSQLGYGMRSVPLCVLSTQGRRGQEIQGLSNTSIVDLDALCGSILILCVPVGSRQSIAAKLEEQLVRLTTPSRIPRSLNRRLRASVGESTAQKDVMPL
ncbi:uncharacterized protein [Physcomitrium patens]|uniref:uncharacterized protein isoform X2 n=1 Tax=Physcomitrium patens TaxID=3218 RepID=UPI00016221DA